MFANLRLWKIPQICKQTCMHAGVIMIRGMQHSDTVIVRKLQAGSIEDAQIVNAARLMTLPKWPANSIKGHQLCQLGNTNQNLRFVQKVLATLQLASVAARLQLGAQA